MRRSQKQVECRRGRANGPCFFHTNVEVDDSSLPPAARAQCYDSDFGLFMRALISTQRIHAVVQAIARQVDSACRRQAIAELTLVCVMDGAFIFSADLMRALRTPSRIVFLKASSYRGTRKGRTSTTSVPLELKGKPVLVVDTIYDTGRTIAAVVRQLRGLARSVWLAVLIEKQDKALVPASEQTQRIFKGITVLGDPFLIGYGLDVGGEFRNLPHIRVYSDDGAGKGKRRHK